MAKKTNRKVKGKNNSKVQLNFDGVDTTSRVPDGDYAVKVKAVTLETQEQKGTQYLKFALVITEGKHEGKNLRHTNSLQPNALFALRNTLEALGYPIPEGAFDLDLEAIVGLEMAVAVENEEYNGKDQSRVVDVFSSDELSDDEDEEDGDEDDDDEDEDYDDSEDSDDDSEDDEDEDEDDSDDEDEDEEEDSDDDDEESDDDDDEDEDEDYDDYDEDELKAMDEEELLEAAEEYEVKPKYKGKGSKKVLNRAATIKAILEVIEED